MVRVKKARRMKTRKMVNKLAGQCTLPRPRHCWRSTLRVYLAPSGVIDTTLPQDSGDDLSADYHHYCARGTISDGPSSILSLYYISQYLYSQMSERSVPVCVQWGALCFASLAVQSTHHKSSLALDLLGNICMATHNPCVTCQPSVMERFPYIHMRNTLRLMIHEMAPDTRRNHSWKLIELGVNKWFYFVAIRFSVDTKSYRVPTLFFYKASFWAVQQFSLIS